MVNANKMNKQFSRWMQLGVCAACLVLAPSCGDVSGGHTLFDPANPNMIDPAKGLTRDDYVNVVNPDKDDGSQIPGLAGDAASFRAKGVGDAPPIPDLAPILAAPQPPKIAETKLVSIAVTDDIPLKDVLVELARLADVDIEVDPGITGGIVFRAKDRPFNDVIQEISDLAGLRYSMKNGLLRVERDTAFVEIYPIDFLNMDRSSSSAVNVNTSVLSGSGGGGGGINSGTQTGITGKSDSDFWKQFEDGVKQILAYKAPALSSTASQAPAQAAAAPGAAPTPATPTLTAVKDSNTFYILNKQASTLTVSGNQRQQELIKRFVKEVSANASAQVLIEAKIVEVDLNQQFQAGIDWTRLGSGRISFNSGTNAFAPVPGVTPAVSPSVITLNADRLLRHDTDLTFAVNLLETFGTAHTLASPRLHAINNQQAVLTYAENYVYFQLTATAPTATTTGGQTTTPTQPTITSSVQTVPIGIILTLQPSIDLRNNEVTMNVRPTYSILTGTKQDPAVAITLAQYDITDPGIQNLVPVVAVREMDSIVKLKSGQVAVIGGYMEDKSLSNDNGLPYVSQVPLVGNLFKGVDRERGVRELVIFIRATIVDSNGSVPEADKANYKKFIDDPRPFKF